MTNPVSPVPANEAARVRLLRSYGVLDTPPNSSLDLLCQYAAASLGTPIALVSLVDQHRQWFKARVGLDATETPRNVAFCAHAIMGGEPFVVEDATADPRFSDNPLVTGGPEIRSYAGMPLEVEPGVRLGTVCVIDRRARTFTDSERDQMRQLGELVVAELKRSVLEKQVALELKRSKRNAQVARAYMTRADIAGRLTALGWWEFDIAAGKLRWSGETRRIHGVGAGFRLTLQRAIGFYEEEARPLVEAAVRTAIEEGRPFKLELPIVDAHGRRRWVRSIGDPELRGGRVVKLSGAAQDVTEVKEAALRVEHLALHDSMTGLANRANFNDALARALARYHACAQDLTLILIDVDHFKAINDTLGHDAGDTAILEVARRLGDAVRDTDIVARLGGDEFAVIAPGLGSRAALDRLLERLVATSAEPWRHAGAQRRLGLSIGAALAEPGLADGEALYKAADLALYDAKDRGRGRARVYEAGARLAA